MRTISSFVLFLILLCASPVLAWTGPTGTAPGSNVAAPINVGTTNQVKNANLGVNGLAVFGNTLNQTSSYLNWGTVAGTNGYGVRDNAGVLEFKNSGGSWSSIQATVANLGGVWTSSGSNVYNTNTGNVGIKIASPTNDLTVKQSTNTQATAGLSMVRSDTTSHSVFFQGGDDNGYLFNYNGGWSIYTGGATLALSIDPSGLSHPLRSMTGTISTYGTTDWGATVDVRRNTSGIAFSALSNANVQLLLDSDGPGPTAIGFHRPGVYGAMFGLDTDNQFSTQGWSAGGGYTGMKVGHLTATGGLLVTNSGRGISASDMGAGDWSGCFGSDCVGGAASPYGVYGNGSSWAGYFNGNLEVTGSAYSGAFYYNSDRRLKKNIAPIATSTSLSDVLHLQPVTFNWIDPKKTGNQIGFIAQEVEKIVPELVSTDASTTMKSVDYARVTPLLVGSVQELNAKIGEQAATISEQQNKINELETRISALESKVK